MEDELISKELVRQLTNKLCTFINIATKEVTYILTCQSNAKTFNCILISIFMVIITNVFNSVILVGIILISPFIVPLIYIKQKEWIKQSITKSRDIIMEIINKLCQYYVNKRKNRKKLE